MPTCTKVQREVKDKAESVLIKSRNGIFLVEATHYSIRVVKEMNNFSQVITHSRRNKLSSPLMGKKVRVSSWPGDLSAYM